MKSANDVVELTKKLVAFDTVSPANGAGDCAAFLAELLEDAGFGVELQHFGSGGTNLIARAGRPGVGPPILFTGHMDTVPLGDAQWSMDPFGGHVDNNRLYGRGTTDMKGGLAAICIAAISQATQCQESAGVTLAFTDREETGCQGAEALCATPEVLGEPGAMIVGEPTSNLPKLGHKGVFWLRCLAKGLTAHGSTPSLGQNAIYIICRAISKLERFDFQAEPHPWFGLPTLNVGVVQGGLNTNSVPDHAEFELDVRTSPAQKHHEIQQLLSELLGPEISYETMVDLPGVFTEGTEQWAMVVKAIVAEHLGSGFEFGTANYFTDASILKPCLDDVPTVVLGPGDAKLAHITDEYVEIDALHDAVNIYRGLIEDWCAGPPLVGAADREMDNI